MGAVSAQVPDRPPRARPSSSEPAAPNWTAEEMKALLARAQGAGRTPTLEAQNQALLALAVAAYRAKVSDRFGDPETLAKAVLRKRDPDHPNVRHGQWLNALLRQFYDDAHRRCDVLRRFARDRRDRAFFEQMTRQAKAAADALAGDLQLEVEGLDGFFSPLPVVDGDKPYAFASQVTVNRQGGIDVDGMERIRFVGHRGPPDAARTSKGSIRELYSAFLFFQRSAESLAAYDPSWAKKRGHVRAVIPARFPAAYLNEIARAAKEAKMRRLHLMVMTKRGELRELRVDLRQGKRRRGRGPAQVPVTCDDDTPMSQCAARVAHARATGRPLWATP